MADDGGKVELSKDVLAPADADALREDLIVTAVKFLQNPKVRQSPLPQRKLFLEKKGLTKTEIDAAVQRSGVKDDDRVTYQPPVSQVPQPLPVTHAPVVPYTRWDKTRDVLHTVALISGLTYAAYKFFKEFIGPYLLGKPSSGSRLDRVEKTVTELQSNVVDTLTKISQTLAALQEMVAQQQQKMELLSHEVNVKQTDESLLRSQDHQLASEIKSELTSIKGLLLNRRQFPPTPSTKSLPSWQLESSPQTATSSSAAATTPTRSLVLPSGDADGLSKDVQLNSNESVRDNPEDNDVPKQVHFSTTSIIGQEDLTNLNGELTTDTVSEQSVDEGRGVPNGKKVEVESIEVKGQIEQSTDTGNDTLNNNEHC